MIVFEHASFNFTHDYSYKIVVLWKIIISTKRSLFCLTGQANQNALVQWYERREETIDFKGALLISMWEEKRHRIWIITKAHHSASHTKRIFSRVFQLIKMSLDDMQAHLFISFEIKHTSSRRRDEWTERRSAFYFHTNDWNNWRRSKPKFLWQLSIESILFSHDPFTVKVRRTLENKLKQNSMKIRHHSYAYRNYYLAHHQIP